MWGDTTQPLVVIIVGCHPRYTPIRGSLATEPDLYELLRSFTGYPKGIAGLVTCALPSRQRCGGACPARAEESTSRPRRSGIKQVLPD